MKTDEKALAIEHTTFTVENPDFSLQDVSFDEFKEHMSAKQSIHFEKHIGCDYVLTHHGKVFGPEDPFMKNKLMVLGKQMKYFSSKMFHLVSETEEEHGFEFRVPAIPFGLKVNELENALIELKEVIREHTTLLAVYNQSIWKD